LPVYALFAAACFPRARQNIVFLLYVVSKDCIRSLHIPAKFTDFTCCDLTSLEG
jgi:Fe2+ transport system protein B